MSCRDAALVFSGFVFGILVAGVWILAGARDFCWSFVGAELRYAWDDRRSEF